VNPHRPSRPPAAALGYALAGLVLGAAATSPALAQPYPVRPLRIIVTYPPGAATDLVARLMAQKLVDAFGQQVIVENRGGAGGIIGTEAGARATPDGYTMLFGTPAGLCINPAMHRKLPYDTYRDFAPISLLVVNPQILLAYPAFPANSIADLLRLARAQPGKINYASVGVGSPNHMGMEMLRLAANIDVVHVPYKGGGPATTDLVAGQVPLLFSSIPSMIPLIKSGRLKVLGISGSQRSPALPDVPPIAETVPGYGFVGTWYGLFTQAAVSRRIVDTLNAAIVAALRSEDLRRQLVEQGSDPRPMAPADFAAFVRNDCENWARAVKAAGITAQ
jgi:tripartite-type tricarboxylate transporter receptor subunit TctC